MARVARESPKVNWCFTSFADESPLMCYKADVHRYLIVGDETCPTTGKHHWQCFVQYNKKVRKAAVLKDFPGLASDAVNGCKGTAQQNIDYCSKGGNWTEMGQVKHERQRSDIHDASAAAATMSFNELLETDHAPVVARSMQFFRALYASRAEKKGLAEAEASISGCVLRTWQSRLLADVTGPVNSRTIYWIWDAIGDTGKSFMAKYLMVRHNAAHFTNGKVADMAYAYACEPIVVIDLARTQADKIDHFFQFMESLKNGVLFSSKYESGKKVFKCPHVVVFANYPPEDGKLSADRLVVREIKKKE